jgi:hypothetical protein
MDTTDTTDTIDITVSVNGTQVASGTLVVVTPTNPPQTQTGTFTPTNGTAVTCTNVLWSDNPNAAVHFTFSLSAANGQFPGPVAPARNVVYNFTGNENAAGSQASGNIQWPVAVASLEGTGDDNATWQGEASGVEPLARKQGAY